MWSVNQPGVAGLPSRSPARVTPASLQVDEADPLVGSRSRLLAQPCLMSLSRLDLPVPVAVFDVQLPSGGILAYPASRSQGIAHDGRGRRPRSLHGLFDFVGRLTC